MEGRIIDSQTANVTDFQSSKLSRPSIEPPCSLEFSLPFFSSRGAHFETIYLVSTNVLKSPVKSEINPRACVWRTHLSATRCWLLAGWLSPARSPLRLLRSMAVAVPGVVTRNPNAAGKHVRRRPIEHVAARRTSRPPTGKKRLPVSQRQNLKLH